MGTLLSRPCIEVLYGLTPCMIMSLVSGTSRTTCSRHWKKITVTLIFLVLCFISVKYLPSPNVSSDMSQPHGGGVKKAIKKSKKLYFGEEIHPAFGQKLVTMSHIDLDTFLQKNKCPACVGTNSCDLFKTGHLKFEKKVHKDGSKAVRFGRMTSQPVVFKRLASDKMFQKYDEYICQSNSDSLNCDISKEAYESPIVKLSSLKAAELRANPLVKQRCTGHPYTYMLLLCATDNLIKVFKTMYDENVNSKLDASEIGYLYTSLILNPEPVLLKFFHIDAGKEPEEKKHSTQINWPFPTLQGSCGRVSIVEHGGTPLHDYLSHNWRTRAELAQQLIDMIVNFETADMEWIIFYGNLHIQNFVVQDGRMLIIDLKDLVVIDRDIIKHYSKAKSSEPETICNAECFTKWTEEFMAIKSEDGLMTKCSEIPHHSTYMYSMACSGILSDLSVHNKFKTKYKGLLHGSPEKDKKTIERLLTECVKETRVGGHRDAALKLRGLLDSYLHLD